MNKIVKSIALVTVCLIVVVCGVYIGYFFTNPKKVNISSELISAANTTITSTPYPTNTASSNPTILPETKIIYTYKGSDGNVVDKEIKATKGMIGMDEEEFKKTLDEFQVIDFNEDEVILQKNVVVEHPEYVVGISDGYLAVFYYDGDNNLKLKEKTLTLVSNLPASDQNLLNKGIKVNNETDLVHLLEDYQS